MNALHQISAVRMMLIISWVSGIWPEKSMQHQHEWTHSWASEKSTGWLKVMLGQPVFVYCCNNYINRGMTLNYLSCQILFFLIWRHAIKPFSPFYIWAFEWLRFYNLSHVKLYNCYRVKNADIWKCSPGTSSVFIHVFIYSFIYYVPFKDSVFPQNVLLLGYKINPVSLRF